MAARTGNGRPASAGADGLPVLSRPLLLAAGLLHWDGIAMKMVPDASLRLRPTKRRRARDTD